MPAIAEHLEMDSHRPESGALYACLTFIRKLLDEHPTARPAPPQPPLAPPPEPRLRIVIDNQSVTDDVEWNFDQQTAVYDYLKADYDILQGIKTMIAALPLTTNIGWIKGHQDDRKPWEELSNAAKANCYADRICDDTHQREANTVGRFPEWVPGLRAALFHNGKLVTKKHDKYIEIAATAPRHRQYLIERSQRRDKFIPSVWTEATFDDIDWKAVESSINSMTMGRRIQISKFANGWTPTKKHLSTHDNSVDGRCFACGRLWEDIDHMLRCRSDRRQQARTTALQNLRQHFTKYHTPAPMAKIIMHCLERWFDDRNPIALHLPTDDPTTARLHHLINVAYDHQTSALPQTMDEKDSGPDLADLPRPMALPKWRTTWERLQGTTRNSPTNDTRRSTTNL
jgi:hypothetical protein